MKKMMLLLLTAFLLFFSTNSFACVGKTLIIGALNTANGSLLAQMMSIIITERTGTTVNIEYFDDKQKLYDAVKKNEINIFTENTGHALQLLKKNGEGDENSIYSSVKKEYKDQFQLTLLNAFGKSPATAKDTPYVDVPIVASSLLIEYPALPRVINKLHGIAQDKSYAKLLSAIESGDKPNLVARDFLKKKRFI